MGTDAGDVGDGPAAGLRLHDGVGVRSHQQRAEQVQLDDLAAEVGGRLGGQRVRRAAGVVDNGVQSAGCSNSVWPVGAAGRFASAAAFAREAAAHDFGNSGQLANLYAIAARVDLDVGLAGVDLMLAPTSPVPADLYQVHRILLIAGRVAEAAEVGKRYIDVATNQIWSLMVRIRQACAEGRVDDAEKYYAEFDFSPFDPANNNIQWLALRTLGRTAEAEELLRPLDQPEYLLRLSELLTYSHFDPSPFPNLVRRLEEQGIMRDVVHPMNFACERQAL